jgi:hypothetical protein
MIVTHNAIQSQNDQLDAKLQHVINDHNTLSWKHDRLLENIVCQSNELIQLKAQYTKLQDQIKNLHIWVS